MTFYQQSPSSAQHILLNTYLGYLWSKFSKTPVHSPSQSLTLSKAVEEGALLI